MGLALLPLEVSELGDLSVDRCFIPNVILVPIRFRWRGFEDVTGVDFSEVAIAEARKLSRDLGIHATFEVGGYRPFSQSLQGFDMVFTSHGVLTWLSDLRVWAEQLAGCLRHGRQLFIYRRGNLAGLGFRG